MSDLNRFGAYLSRITKRFAVREDGNIGLLFGLSLLPMAMAAGTAVDYSRVSQARSQLQAAADSAVLSVARRAPTLTDAQLTAEAQSHFRAVLTQRADLAALPIVVTRGDRRVQIAAAGAMPTTFMKLFGYQTLDVSTRVEAGFGDRKAEIVLALDNTGSMDNTGPGGGVRKIDALKTATTNLIAAARASSPVGSGMIKVGIVPFETEVRVDASVYRNHSWLAFSGNPSSSFNDISGRLATQSEWKGCIMDRGPGYDTNDRHAQTALGESLHPAVGCANASMTTVQPLTDNWSALQATVDSMKPGGCTNVTIGARFGLAALSPTDVIGAGAAPFGDANTDKYLIVLTDGDNTQNRFADGCGGTMTAAERAARQASIDAKTRAMCNDIKAKQSRGAGKPDVKVFTVRVIAGNAALLSDCATTASMYYDVSQASQIDVVFRDIIRQITSLRLTM